MMEAFSHKFFHRRHVRMFAFCAFFVSQTAAQPVQTCHLPDHNPDFPGNTPCDTSAEFSHCCNTADVCLTNGCCFHSQYGYIYRPSCADQTWKDPSCPYYCADVNTASGVILMMINDAQPSLWCCGYYDSTSNLCENPAQGSSKPFELANSTVIYDRTTGYTLPNNTITQSNPATVTHVSQATVTVTTAPQNGNSHDLAIGLEVGLPLGFLLLLTTSLLLHQLRQRKKLDRDVAKAGNDVQALSGSPVNDDPYVSKPELAGRSVKRASGHPEVTELEAH